MAASSYYNGSLSETSQPTAYANPIPLRPVTNSYTYNGLQPQGPPTQANTYTSQAAPLTQETSYGGPSRIQTRARSKWSRYIRIIKLFSNAITTLFTTLMEGIMVYVLIKFYSTRNEPGGGRSSPWSADTKLWPTWLLLSASGVTLIATIFSLFALCCVKKHGAGVRRRGRRVIVLEYAIHVIAWLLVAFLYRWGKTGDDLWGWSCGDKAKAVQEAFKTELNFQALCDIQTSSWWFAVVEVVAKVVFAFAHYFVHRKTEEDAGWKLAGGLLDVGADQAF